MKSKNNFKIFIINLIAFLMFGFSLYQAGTCDQNINGRYLLVNNSQKAGYTKVEAAEMCGVSVRQFDRWVKQGKLPQGMKVRNQTTLYWDQKLIDRLSRYRKRPKKQ